MTPQLIEYIKSALASGQSREIITQALVQNGWKVEDIEQGFSNVATPTLVYSAPVPAMASSIPVHSKLPLILGAVAVVAVLAVASGFILINKKATNTEIVEPASTESTSYATSSSSNAQAVATTTTQTSIAVKGTASLVKSETDFFGTNLYALKEGETVRNLGEKSVVANTANGYTELEKTVVTYTRHGDIIERSVAKTTPSGHSGADSVYMLNARQNYEHGLSIVKARIQKDCPSTSTPDCATSYTQLKDIETSCVNAFSDKEVNLCMGTDFSAEMNFGGFLWAVFLAGTQ